MFQKIELRKTRDFSAKINITFEFLRQNFQILAKSILYISGPFIVIQGIFMGLYNQRVFAMPGSEGMAQGWVTQLLGNLGAAFLFALMAYTTTLITVNEFVRLYETKADPSTIEVTEIWEGVKTKFFKTLAAIFLVGLISVFATIFLIIPGIYVGVCLSLVAPILLIEERDIGESINRCFKLIVEKWWSTFGLLIVAVLIASFMGVVFQIPQYVLMFMGAMLKVSDSMAEPPDWQKLATILASILSVMGAGFLQSISMVAVIFQYYNLVERQESRGLMTKLESFGKPEANVPRTDETY